MRVRNQADLHTATGQLTQHRRNIVVEMKVMARRPLVVDLAGAGVERRARSAHLLDDSSRIPHEYLAVVHVFLLLVEDDRRGANAVGKAGRLDGDAVVRAKALIPFALERWTRIDQREVNVEEHRGSRG